MLLKGFVEDFRRASYLSFNNFDEYVMIKLDKNAMTKGIILHQRIPSLDGMIKG